MTDIYDIKGFLNILPINIIASLVILCFAIVAYIILSKQKPKVQNKIIENKVKKK